MKIQFYCPRWGSESLAWPEFCRKVRLAGYQGVEASLPWGDRPATDAILRALADEGLELVAQHWETVNPDLGGHKTEYRARLEWLAAARPQFINSQTGRDWFSFDQNQELLAVASEVARQTGVVIRHETHRGKFAYAAGVTQKFLEADPSLRISADFSHWCVVSESLLSDQGPSLDLAISRADHIHARVGHAEAPQVTDPRAPEWKEALETHLGWWDRIIDFHRKAGATVFTVTPEFGPAPYMPGLPFTTQPVADQWGINVFMMEMLRERWKGSSPSAGLTGAIDECKI